MEAKIFSVYMLQAKQTYMRAARICYG